MLRQWFLFMQKLFQTFLSTCPNPSRNLSNEWTDWQEGFLYLGYLSSGPVTVTLLERHCIVVIGLELRSCWKGWRQIHRRIEPLKTGISWECSWCHLSLRSHCCCFLKPFHSAYSSTLEVKVDYFISQRWSLRARWLTDSGRPWVTHLQRFVV